jgi:hypothetical protein
MDYINHPILSVIAGVAGQCLAASAGTALWMRVGSNDITCGGGNGEEDHELGEALEPSLGV